MRKVAMIIFLSSLLSLLLAIANGCKSTKHIAQSVTKLDSAGARVIDSVVTSEISHIEKDLAEHSEIKNDQSEKITVTTTEYYLQDPKTGAPQLKKRTVKTERKKNNKKISSSTKLDQSVIDIKRDSAGKKDSTAAIVHRIEREREKDVKKKTPLGVYAIAGCIIVSLAIFLICRYGPRKKNPPDATREDHA